MKLCGKCGNQIEDSVTVCPYCVQNEAANNPEGGNVSNVAPSEPVISEETINKAVDVVDKVATGVKIVKLIPVIFIGIVLTIIGIFSLISGISTGAKYKGETTGTFVELTNCDEYTSGEGYCDAKYTYQVNGVSYEAFSSFATELDYQQSLNIHYDLDNPAAYSLSDSGVSSVSFVFIILGIVLVAISIFSIKNKNVRVSVGR